MVDWVHSRRLATHGVLRGALPRGGLGPLQTPCHAWSSTRSTATWWTGSTPDSLQRMEFYEERCHVVDWVHSRRLATHGALGGALPRGGLGSLQTPCHAWCSTRSAATWWTGSTPDALPRMELYEEHCHVVDWVHSRLLVVGPLQTPCHAWSSTRSTATLWTGSTPDALPRMELYEEHCHMVDWVHSRRLATHGVLRGALPCRGLSPRPVVSDGVPETDVDPVRLDAEKCRR